MVRNKLIYVGILAAAVWFSMLYSYRGVRFGIAIMVLLPLGGMIQILYGRCNSRVYIESVGNYQEKGEEGILCLCYENKGVLPIAAVCVSMEWEAPGEPGSVSEQWIYAIPVNGTARREVTLRAAHCGHAVIRVKKVRLYDYMGLCAINGYGRQEKGIYIIPTVKELSVGQSKMTYIDAMGGDRDIQEGYEIRDYRTGDSLHRIHWKLTARLDELQIRDFEGRKTDCTKLYFNIHSFDWNEENAQMWDDYMELAVGLMLALYRGGRLDHVIWFNMGQEIGQEVNREEDIFDCMYRLLALDVTRMGGGVLPEDVLHLDMDLRLYMGEQCIYG